MDIDRSPKPLRGPGHRPVVGYIGQIAPHKGTDLLIKAFQDLPENSAELLIYGPADQDPAYMATLKELADGHAVAFMGTFPSQDMARILRQMDLLVIPSRWYENSPLVLLNALATHTPVLVADVAGMTEFLEQGINGFSFKRGSADDLARHLKVLIADQKPYLVSPRQLITLGRQKSWRLKLFPCIFSVVFKQSRTRFDSFFINGCL